MNCSISVCFLLVALGVLVLALIIFVCNAHRAWAYMVGITMNANAGKTIRVCTANQALACAVFGLHSRCIHTGSISSLYFAHSPLYGLCQARETLCFRLIVTQRTSAAAQTAGGASQGVSLKWIVSA